MKKFLSFFAVAALLLSACEKNPQNPDNEPDGNEPGGNNPNTPTELHESLQGTNYYPLILDGESYNAIKDKIAADLRPNDFTANGVHFNGYSNLWIWEGTLTGGAEPVGPNFYGNLEGWTTLEVTGSGWFGFGIEISTKDDVVGFGGGQASDNQAELIASGRAALNAMKKIDSTYALHIGLKSQRNSQYKFILYDGVHEIPVIIGSAAGDGDFWFQRDGEWGEIIIPMSFFFNKGLSYNNITDATTGLNIIGSSQPDGTWPSDYNLDAVFFYQPK